MSRGVRGEATEGALLEVHLPSVERGARTALSNVHLELCPGEVLFVIGPNGSGKSTLIDACLDLVRTENGSILYSGRPLATLTYRERPRFMALVGREETDALGFTVREVLSLASPDSLELSPSNCEPLRSVALPAEFLSRKLAHLSQGERQRVHLWRGFLQDAFVLFWDEATAHLDLAHREEALQALVAYAGQGHAAVVVVHEIELALRHASRILVLHEGRPVALGPPQECLSRELLREVFGIRAEVHSHQGVLRLNWEHVGPTPGQASESPRG